MFNSQTVVCIASGGSLNAKDCEVIKQSKLPTVAVNNSWQIAPFCKVIYAGDPCWWEKNHEDINIPAIRASCWRSNERFGCIYHSAGNGDYNSGMRAIQFAISQRAKQIILLGYDCSLKNGVHWHGSHKALPNPDSHKVASWHNQFALVEREARQAEVDIVNASRYTELNCFRKMSLEDVLKEVMLCI